MNRISILDCTLRDGGYVNEFKFGNRVIKKIIEKLAKASIDIIECGFMRKGEHDKDKSLFGSVEEIAEAIGEKNHKLMYVAMIQYGAIESDDISIYDGSSVDGIRVTFHESEISGAIELCKELMKKGYKVFMQPVGTATYSDASLLKLIEQMNELRPFAFYIVDTLGTMYKNDLLRLFYLVDHNLDKNIVIGFHSHNNLQLAFANAQELMQLNSSRNLIIDSSVFGMGRGAGNLNTELVTQYINTNFGLYYDNVQILEIIDEFIRPLSYSYKWGYDAAYYIASIHKCHPNYASFLLNRQTLHAKDMNAILGNMQEEKRGLFDKKYIEKIYLAYMSRHVEDQEVVEQFEEILKNKNVLVLAPGKTISINSEMIQQKIDAEQLYVFSVNFIPRDIHVDTLFISNMKRFSSIEDVSANIPEGMKIVATSNIVNQSDNNTAIINYSSYLNEDYFISDNAGMMCLNFLNRAGVKKVYLAGFDGFKTRSLENYYDDSLYVQVEDEQLVEMNKAISEKLSQMSRQIEIIFLTKSIYEFQ